MGRPAGSKLAIALPQSLTGSTATLPLKMMRLYGGTSKKGSLGQISRPV